MTAAERKALACELAAHVVGLGDLCAVVARRFRPTSRIGLKMHRSSWTALGVLADAIAGDGQTVPPQPPSALAELVSRLYLDHDYGRSPLTETFRLAGIAYLAELLRLLGQAQTIVATQPEPLSQPLRPKHQIEVWTAVQAELVGLGPLA